MRPYNTAGTASERQGKVKIKDHYKCSKERSKLRQTVASHGKDGLYKHQTPMAGILKS